MKRILCWTVSAYILGIVLADFVSVECFLELILLLSTIFFIRAMFSHNGLLRQVMVLTVCFLIGIGHYHIYEDIQINKVEPYIGLSCTYNGRIIDMPVKKERKTEYVLKVNQVEYKNKLYNTTFKIILICYDNANTAKYQYGDWIQFKSVLEYPPQAMNAGDFDYSMYLKSRGIYAISYLKPYQILKLGEVQKKLHLTDVAYHIKEFIIHTTEKYIPGLESALLKGILVGDRTDFTEEMAENFADSGLSHLVAVSGNHVVIILLVLTYVLQTLGFRKTVVHVISIGAVLLFMLVTGCTASVMRAGIMAIVVLAAYLLNREADTLTSLFFSALLILLWNPLTIHDVGLQLSFSATAALLFFYKPIYLRLTFIPEKIREVITATIAAQIGTIPFTVYHFNNISMVSLFSNIVAVPLTTIALISGILLMIIGNIFGFLGNMAAGFTFFLLKLLLCWSKFCAGLPFAVLNCPTPSVVAMMIYAIFIIMLYHILKGKNMKYIKLSGVGLIFLIVICFAIHVFLPNHLEVTFINVGQGDCTLIHFPNGKNILIDSGGNSGNSSFDVGRQVVVPYLIRRGIMQLDAVVVSHFHDDHAEGILSVMDEIPVKILILPVREEQVPLHKKLLEKARAYNAGVYYVSRKDYISIDKNFNMDILWPNIAYDKKSIYNENNESLVLRLDYGSISFLFTGDIEEETERCLLEMGDNIDVDVLKVAHHGSNTSSTDSFLNAASPQYAVISVGRNNNFGHPAEEVLKRLEKYGMSIYRTDLNGTVTFIADRKKIKNVKVLRKGEIQ